MKRTRPGARSPVAEVRAALREIGVTIDYDERYGKPTVVTRPGLGTIKVSYKPNGDIAKVDSAEGPTVASQVASTFNNLLDVIAPATQELYL